LRRFLRLRRHGYAGPIAAPEPHVHVETFRVAMVEVDASQIHFTNFYRWMDRSWTAWLAEVGRPFTRILEEGPGIPIVESHCGFRARVMLDDLVTVRTSAGGIGRTSFRSRHRFTRGEELVAEGELVHVCVDRATREPVPVPGWLRERAEPG
jgi:acyl-CoA thioester hydrolase